MASPYAGLATHGQDPLQGGGRLRPRPARKGRQPPVGVAARRGGACGQKRHLRAQPLTAWHLQGGPTAGCPQGATAATSLPPAGARCRPQGWSPLSRSTAGGQRQPPPAQGQRRRRRGGKRARASF
ncbi:hypothetical protein GW17_00044704 [Ensete ventricosum]|nr:hypothetical protein GW17_00044704 [Ensete ventricosum]